MSHPSTFSIVAADPTQDEVGIAVESKFLAAGALVPWVRVGVGAVATQAATNVQLAQAALELLVGGATPQDALDRVLENDPAADDRQVGVVDLRGRSASHTGESCYAVAGSLTGENFAVQGNLLASDQVVGDMAAAFRSSDHLSLARRMLAALDAGQQAGGDRRGQQSAALVVAKPGRGYGGHDCYIDLRVDDHATPIQELHRLLGLSELYFGKPRDEDILTVGDDLAIELSRRLSNLGRLEPETDLWAALFDWVNWENLEERWVGRSRIDREVLDILRKRSDAAAGPGRSPAANS